MADAEVPFGAIWIDSHFRESLIEAAVVAFREVARTDVIPISCDRASKSSDITHRTAFIELTFPAGRGLLALGVSDAIAVALARRVLAGEVSVIDGDLAADCLGEIANVIAGHGKALLSGTDGHYVFGTPKIFAGPAPATPFGPSLDWHTLVFQSDLGEITLRVAVVNRA